MAKEKEDEEMDIFNFLARATYQIVLIEPESKDLRGFGSGCIVQYNDRFFLLSVHM